jgi:hypothetical protein
MFRRIATIFEMINSRMIAISTVLGDFTALTPLTSQS